MRRDDELASEPAAASAAVAAADAAAAAAEAAAEAAAAAAGAQASRAPAGAASGSGAEAADASEVADEDDGASLAATEAAEAATAVAVAALAEAAERAALAAREGEERTYKFAKMSSELLLMDEDRPELATQVARRALEHAGRGAVQVTAAHRGVALARNVTAKACGRASHQALEQARSALEDYLPPQCEVAMEMAEEARAGAHEGTLACDHQLHDATLPSAILTDEIRERLCEERAAIQIRVRVRLRVDPILTPNSSPIPSLNLKPSPSPSPGPSLNPSPNPSQERAAFARLEGQANARLEQALELALARSEEQAAAARDADAAREVGAGLEAAAAAVAAAAAAAAARAGGRRAGVAGRGEARADDGGGEDAELRRALALSLAELEQEDPELEEALRLSGMLDGTQSDGDWGPDETPTSGDTTPAPSAPGPAGELSLAVPRVGGAGGAGLRAAGAGWKGVEAQLKQGNWSFSRISGGHRVYSRWVGQLAESGTSAAPQLTTLASWG